MATATIDEIVAAAKIFARDYHTREIFAGFTETEVMQGVAAFNIALTEVIEAREAGRKSMEPEAMFGLLEFAVGINDNNWNRVLAVYDIVTKIQAARMLEHQDGGCAESA